MNINENHSSRLYESNVNLSREIATQRLHNRIQARVMTKLGFPDTAFRVAFAIHSHLNGAQAGESVPICRKTLAAVLRVGGHEESQLSSVSRLVNKLKKAQRKCGRKLITIIPGRQVGEIWYSPEYTDHYGPLIHKADTLFPDWRDNPDMEAALVEWVVENLEPETRGPEPEPPPGVDMDEFCRREIQRIERRFNQTVDQLENGYRSPDGAIRYAETLIATLSRDLASIKKTARARLSGDTPPAESATSYPQRGRVCVAEIAPPSVGLSPNVPSLPGLEIGGGVAHVLPPPSTENKELTESLPALYPPPTPEEAREKHAMESLCVFISRAYRQFFFRLENESRDTIRHLTLPASEAIDAAGAWLRDGAKRRCSFMARPQLEAADTEIVPRFIHLDDLDQTRFERLRPWGALGFETSPDRYQIFVFVTADKPVAEAIKKRLVRGINSDKGANGMFRVPGSRNFKRTRGGCDVRLIFATFGDSWSPEKLEASGLLAPPEPAPPPRPRPVSNNGHWKFPDYERCIRDAPLKDTGGPDYSAADLAWANISRERGVPEEAAYGELERLREAFDGKPSRHPDRGATRGYITRTIDKAYK